MTAAARRRGAERRGHHVESVLSRLPPIRTMLEHTHVYERFTNCAPGIDLADLAGFPYVGAARRLLHCIHRSHRPDQFASACAACSSGLRWLSACSCSSGLLWPARTRSWPFLAIARAEERARKKDVLLIVREWTCVAKGRKTKQEKKWRYTRRAMTLAELEKLEQRLGKHPNDAKAQLEIGGCWASVPVWSPGRLSKDVVYRVSSRE